MSLEILCNADLPVTESLNLRDYIWRQVVERQAHFWAPMLSATRNPSDAEMRAQLSNTALFQAAQRAQFGVTEVNDMMSRGVFDIEDIVALGRPGELRRLVLTTVGLAGEGCAGEVTKVAI
jgi:hypothetical protein